MGFAEKPHDLAAEATYLCDVVKPQMGVVRGLVDKGEGLLQKSLYPFPTYEEMIYSHHSWGNHPSGLYAFLDQWSDRWLGWSSSQGRSTLFVTNGWIAGWVGAPVRAEASS